MYNPDTKAGFAAYFAVSAWLAVGLYQQYKNIYYWWSRLAVTHHIITSYLLFHCHA
jgi:hypothetical protein